jgi:serine/threonine-protein kinase
MTAEVRMSLDWTRRRCPRFFGAGLVFGNTSRVGSGLVPLGDIIVQNPARGTAVVLGTPVNLVISAGPAKYSVPDVVGLTQTQAQEDIAAAALTVGRVAPMSNASIPIGIVISQDPLSETALTEGSSVNLIVSSGPP